MAKSKGVNAKYIDNKLEELFPEVSPPLNHTDPFTLLIAVLLSAQCTDKRVNVVTKELFALGSTPAQLIQLGAKKVEEIIRPCGLAPRKSKNIVDLSEIILAKHGGKVPANFAKLEELPGVGHKTASVVMAQAFGHPAFPVDTHIHRLAQQWELSNGKSVVQSEMDLKRAFPMNRWNRLHLQIFFLAESTVRPEDATGFAV